MRLRRFKSLRAIVAGLVELCPQVIEKERIEHLEDVRHARVVHAERAALLVLRDGLDHRAEDVRIDLLPIEPADVQQVGAGHLAEARYVGAREEAAVDVGEVVGPTGTPAAARSAVLVFMARNMC